MTHAAAHPPESSRGQDPRRWSADGISTRWKSRNGSPAARRREREPRRRASTSWTWAPTASMGFSAASGSWKIIARSRPRLDRHASGLSCEGFSPPARRPAGSSNGRRRRPIRARASRSFRARFAHADLACPASSTGLRTATRLPASGGWSPLTVNSALAANLDRDLDR